MMLCNHKQGGVMKLAGKKALVTAGNSGIGFATARLFVTEGAQAAIIGRDQKTLDVVDGGATGAPWGAPFLRG
jgi:NAD(P)-dependent dehydrogenase (short-subunit alcohol dehydrogenase family)